MLAGVPFWLPRPACARRIDVRDQAMGALPSFERKGGVAQCIGACSFRMECRCTPAGAVHHGAVHISTHGWLA